MTDKKLIERLEEIIVGGDEYFIRMGNEGYSDLIEIKQRLEQQAPPNDELVEKILRIGISCSEETEMIQHYAPPLVVNQRGYDQAAKDIEEKKQKARAEIRKLLQGNQSRQQEKPRITRGEIRMEINKVKACTIPIKEACSSCVDIVADLFESKGVRVEEK